MRWPWPLIPCGQKHFHTPQRSDSAVSRPPSLEQLVKARDYEGAIALLDSSSSSVNAGGADAVRQQQEWLAYAHFHNGECEKALEIYRALLAQVDPDPQHHTYAAACLYHMGQLAEAEDEAAHVRQPCIYTLYRVQTRQCGAIDACMILRVYVYICTRGHVYLACRVSVRWWLHLLLLCVTCCPLWLFPCNIARCAGTALCACCSCAVPLCCSPPR